VKDGPEKKVLETILDGLPKVGREAQIIYMSGLMASAWQDGHSHCFHVEKPNNTKNPYLPEEK
jgi:hypothetical protein